MCSQLKEVRDVAHAYKVCLPRGLIRVGLCRCPCELFTPDSGQLSNTAYEIHLLVRFFLCLLVCLLLLLFSFIFLFVLFCFVCGLVCLFRSK